MSVIVRLLRLAASETEKALPAAENPAAIIAAGQDALFEVVQEIYGFNLNRKETTALIIRALSEEK
tara:strand:- start:357 stop:554 length:198 start_codon:yes stop_codon:yes gene_type:complete